MTGREPRTDRERHTARTTATATQNAGAGLVDRLERLESQLERHRERIEAQEATIDGQAETIAAQRDRIEELEGRVASETAGSPGPAVSRRTALKAGGLLTALGLGATTATASDSSGQTEATGQVGTADRPLSALYTDRLDGGITGGESVSELTGGALSIADGRLTSPWGEDGSMLTPRADADYAGVEAETVRETLTLPSYETIGDDPDAVVDAMSRLFAKPDWVEELPGDWHSGTYQPRSDVEGADFHGTFYSGVVHPSGVVVFAPDHYEHIGLYDPVADEYRDGPEHGELIGDDDDELVETFRGATLAPSGDVVFTPFGSENVGVYDPVSDEYVSGDSHGQGYGAFYGAALAPTGTVVFAPYNSNTVAEYDPETDTVLIPDTHTGGDRAFQGAVLAPTGEIVFAPRDADHVGIYDPVTGDYRDGPSHGEGDRAFGGAVLAPTGEIVFVPSDSEYVGVYDPIDDEYRSGPALDDPLDLAFAGGTVTPTGEIVFAPQGSDHVGLYDPKTDTYQPGPQTESLFTDALLTPQGEVVFVPIQPLYETSSVGAFSRIGDLSVPRGAAMHPLVNNS